MFLTLNTAVSAESQAVFFSLGLSPNPNQSPSPVWVPHSTTTFVLHSGADIKYVHLQCWQVHLRSCSPAEYLKHQDPKLRKWSKFSWSANDAWVPVLSVSTCSCRELQFPRCRRVVPTVWSNFQRCCNRTAFQRGFQFSLLAVKGVIAMRQTASACAEFRQPWAIRCLCLSLPCWNWQWDTDSCMRQRSPCGVQASLITLFTSAFINLPYWMLPGALTIVHATSPVLFDGNNSSSS